MNKKDYKHTNNFSREVVLGTTSKDEPYGLSISDAPNMIIAGSIYSGKTEMVHTMIISMMTQFTPQDLKIYITDPKQVEYSFYENAPHVVKYPATNTEEAISMIEDLVRTAEKRIKLLEETSTKSIEEYNSHVNYKKSKFLSNIVLFVDEYPYLANKKEDGMGRFMVDEIAELAEVGNKVGIHLVLTTTTLSSSVITEKILNLFPTKVLRGDMRRIGMAGGGLADFIGELDDISSSFIMHNGNVDKVYTNFISDDKKREIVESLANTYPNERKEPGKLSSYLDGLGEKGSLGDMIKDMFVE